VPGVEHRVAQAVTGHLSPELVLLAAVAATYSVTMLVARDALTAPVRERVLGRLTGHAYAGSLGGAVSCRCGHVFSETGDLVDHVHDVRQAQLQELPLPARSRFSYLITCPWCVSAWVAAPVVWSAWCFGTRAWWFVPAVILSARAVAGTWATLASPGR
jgi:hypothetical protein